MTVVAITRGGFGGAWQFETLLDAQIHPLIQYGDPVLDGPDSLLDEYRVLELPVMLSRLDLTDLAASLSGRLSELAAAGRTSRQQADDLRSDHSHTDVWTALLRTAQAPPENAARVLELVQCDREWDLENRKRRTTMAEAKTKESKTPKEKKAPAEKSVNGLPLTTKLDFGSRKVEDKDVSYGVDEKNNPKRGGAAARFAKYKKGITIQEALDAGMSPGNVKHDLEKGYVVARVKA